MYLLDSGLFLPQSLRDSSLLFSKAISFTAATLQQSKGCYVILLIIGMWLNHNHGWTSSQVLATALPANNQLWSLHFSSVVCWYSLSANSCPIHGWGFSRAGNTIGSQLIVAETPPTNCALLVANKSLSGTKMPAGIYCTSHGLRTYIPGVLLHYICKRTISTWESVVWGAGCLGVAGKAIIICFSFPWCRCCILWGFY